MTDQLPAPVPGSVRDLLRREDIQQRFRDVLGAKAAQFIASLANMVYQDHNLADCEPMSVIAAAMVAASLDLPIDRNLGFAYIIPYNDTRRRTKVAQFQMGYKGYVQLALRTAQYQTIHVSEVYAGEVRGIDRFTGTLKTGAQTGPEIVGYIAYLKLLNGFEKHVYMTVEELRAHGQKYSKTYSRDDSKWKTDFDGMARKTVVRRLLTKWGMLSIEMRQAIAAEIPPDDAPEAAGGLTPEQVKRGTEALFGDDDVVEGQVAETPAAPAPAPEPPAADPSQTAAEPTKKTNGNGNGNTHGKTAGVKGDMRAFDKRCAELAEQFPAYRLPTGHPDRFHILGAARACGFSEVTNDNLDVVFEAIAARAAGKQHPATEPAAAEESEHPF